MWTPGVRSHYQMRIKVLCRHLEWAETELRNSNSPSTLDLLRVLFEAASGALDVLEAMTTTYRMSLAAGVAGAAARTGTSRVAKGDTASSAEGTSSKSGSPGPDPSRVA